MWYMRLPDAHNVIEEIEETGALATISFRPAQSTREKRKLRGVPARKMTMSEF